MSKFYGPIGFGFPIENPAGSGIYEEDIVERNYRGEVTKNIKRFDNNQKVNDDLVINNILSIISDPYASNNLFAVKYVKWLGTYWKVNSAEVQFPRIVLTLGGVYNGPTAGTSQTTEEYPEVR